MQDSVKELLGRRKNRAIAIILTCKETECDSYLPDSASYRLRKVVLDQVNELHDLCVDVIESLDTDNVVLNEFWLKKIEAKLELIYRQTDDEDDDI